MYSSVTLHYKLHLLMIQQTSCRPILGAQYIEITRTHTRIHTNPLADSYVYTIIKHTFFCKMLRQRCLVCSKCNDNTKRLLLVERLSAICPLWLQGFRLITNEFCLSALFLLDTAKFSVDRGRAVTEVENDNFFQGISLSDRDLKF
jgi:hypothetical protein